MWLYNYRTFFLFLGINWGELGNVFSFDENILRNQKGISNGRDLIKSTWQPNEKVCCREMRIINKSQA